MDPQAFELLTSQLNDIKTEIKAIRSDVSTLLQFKWKILGMASCAGFIGSVLAKLVGVI